MKFMLIPVLFSLFLHCTSQSAITIESTPAANADGFIHASLQDTVSLTCKTDIIEDNELVWLRNDAVVSLQEGNKQGQSKLCISPVILEDTEATFTCYQRSNISDKVSVVLNITYPPALTESEQVTVEEEATLALQCNIKALPPVSSVTWILNGTKVDLGTGLFTITTDTFTSKLSTEKVHRLLHEGLYQCIADSPMYGIHTMDFKVTVTAKTLKFPLFPMIAGIVVVCLTAILAVVSRWKKITKCCK